MREERLKRYRDKLNLVTERIDDVESWVPHSIEEFVSDKKTRLAVYKASQEMIETSMDIIAMMCKDLKIVPKDDYTNIKALEDRGIINKKLTHALVHANGLRNRLVHRYNVLDDKIAFESIKELLPNFKKFLSVTEKWLKERI